MNHNKSIYWTCIYIYLSTCTGFFLKKLKNEAKTRLSITNVAFDFKETPCEWYRLSIPVCFRLLFFTDLTCYSFESILSFPKYCSITLTTVLMILNCDSSSVKNWKDCICAISSENYPFYFKKYCFVQWQILKTLNMNRDSWLVNKYAEKSKVAKMYCADDHIYTQCRQMQNFSQMFITVPNNYFPYKN